jgi:hypothetical protein
VTIGGECGRQTAPGPAWLRGTTGPRRRRGSCDRLCPQAVADGAVAGPRNRGSFREGAGLCVPRCRAPAAPHLRHSARGRPRLPV